MEFELLNTEEAATYLGLKKRTLEYWRFADKKNLTYINVGGVVKYNKSDLIEFLKKNTVRSGK